MNNLREYAKFYWEHGICISSKSLEGKDIDWYNAGQKYEEIFQFKAIAAGQIYGIAGCHGIRVVKVMGIKNMTVDSLNFVVRAMLFALRLPSNYPWIVTTSESVAVIVKCTGNQSDVGNRSYMGRKDIGSTHTILLWEASFLLPSFDAKVRFLTTLPQIDILEVRLEDIESCLSLFRGRTTTSPDIFNREHVDTHYDTDDFVIVTKGEHQGLSLSDGTVVIEPIYHGIELRHECFLAHIRISDYRYGHQYYSLYPKTYGEGLILREEHIRTKKGEGDKIFYGWPNIQSFIDMKGNPVLTFNEDWFRRNDIPFFVNPISCREACFFKGGKIQLELVSDNVGRLYSVDRDGNAEYLKHIDYGSEPPSLDSDY